MCFAQGVKMRSTDLLTEKGKTMNNEIICPISKAPCIGRYCAFYDNINRMCPHGAEYAREKLNLLRSIEAKLDTIKTVGLHRW